MSVLLHSISSISQASEAVIGAVRHTEKDRTHTHRPSHSCTHTHTHTPALQYVPLGLKTGRVLRGEFTTFPTSCETERESRERVGGGNGGGRGNSGRQKQRGRDKKARERTRQGASATQTETSTWGRERWRIDGAVQMYVAERERERKYVFE